MYNIIIIIYNIDAFDSLLRLTVDSICSLCLNPFNALAYLQPNLTSHASYQCMHTIATLLHYYYT